MITRLDGNFSTSTKETGEPVEPPPKLIPNPYKNPFEASTFSPMFGNVTRTGPGQAMVVHTSAATQLKRLHEMFQPPGSTGPTGPTGSAKGGLFNLSPPSEARGLVDHWRLASQQLLPWDPNGKPGMLPRDWSALKEYLKKNEPRLQQVAAAVTREAKNDPYGPAIAALAAKNPGAHFKLLASSTGVTIEMTPKHRAHAYVAPRYFEPAGKAPRSVTKPSEVLVSCEATHLATGAPVPEPMISTVNINGLLTRTQAHR